MRTRTLRQLGEREDDAAGVGARVAQKNAFGECFFFAQRVVVGQPAARVRRLFCLGWLLSLLRAKGQRVIEWRANSQNAYKHLFHKTADVNGRRFLLFKHT